MMMQAQFPLPLADGTELSEDGANCFFLAPQVMAKRLDVLVDGHRRSAWLHRAVYTDAPDGGLIFRNMMLEVL